MSRTRAISVSSTAASASAHRCSAARSAPYQRAIRTRRWRSSMGTIQPKSGHRQRDQHEPIE
jgi:hypothetical protein